MSAELESKKKTAEKIRSGEFFRESINAYNLSYNDPMSERYFFIGLTALSVLIMFLSVIAIVMIHPLSKDVPFIYYTDDLVNDFPKMRPLGAKDADPNVVMKRFLTENYLKLREEYNVNKVDRNARGIRSQSTDEVFQEYQRQNDPRNPQSPIARFQRNASRQVEILRFIAGSNGDLEKMTIEYREKIFAGTDISSRKMRAIITFRFDPIRVSQETGKGSAMSFQVVGYQTEALN